MMAGTDGARQRDPETGISYRIDGPDGAPWLILSNSLAADLHSWDPQIDALCATRRVLRYDTRGHGQSHAKSPPYAFTDLVGDVLSLCDRLQIERSDFMGLSAGGMTGLELAIRAPDRVGKLVCCDARADAPEPYRQIWDGNIAKLEAEGIAALVEPTLQRWFSAPFLEDPANSSLLAGIRATFANTSPEGYTGVARSLQSLDILDRLDQISCPTLYVVGDQDMAAPVAVMQDMADRTKGARLVVIDDAAHLSNIEQPQAFLDAVSGFLNLANASQ